jgi:hypothetical protein
MPVPTELPIGLSDEFATDASRQAMWRAFLKKNEIAVTSLSAVVSRLRATLEPALVQAGIFSDVNRLVEIDKQDSERGGGNP